jgi:sigma-E factor negative regulatory protein RseA
MTDAIREQVSAFLDGELPANESELLLKRLARDGELREVFGRYALYGEAAREGGASHLSRGFAERVNRAIDGELQVAPRVMAVAGRRWWRPVAGAAIAAGVAAVSVLALQHRASAPVASITLAAQSQSDKSPSASGSASMAVPAPPSLAKVAAPRSTEAASYTTPAVSRQNGAVLSAARLTNYVVAHSEYSSPLGRRNVLSGLIADDQAAEGAAP